MSSPIRAVVFDVGGVLEKVEPLEVWLQRTADGLDTTLSAIEAALQSVEANGRSALGIVPEGEYRDAVAAALGLSDTQADTFMLDLWDWYCGELDHDLVAFVKRLRPYYPTAILSNSADGARREEEQRYGFSELFDPIIYSHEVGLGKPDPRIYALTCEKLGIAPHEAIFLDDTQTSVDGAAAVGMRALLHTSTPKSIRAISDLLDSHSSG